MRIFYLEKETILVTGGRDRLSRVHALYLNGTFKCTLPDLPYPRQYHTQTGLTACGGSRGLFNDENTGRDCITFTKGSWVQSHNLTNNRYGSTAWKSPLGIILMGGFGGQGVGKNAELVTTPGHIFGTGYFSSYASTYVQDLKYL